MEQIEKQHIDFTSHHILNVPIHTDLYQITMAYAYYKQNKFNTHAVFEMFFRSPPFGGQYVIFGGLREAMSYIQNYKFTPGMIEYIKEVLPKNADQGFFDCLSKLDCSKIKIYAFREGSLVFPREPIMKIEGPLGLVQMLETNLLNLVGFPSLIATNAQRMRKLVGDQANLLEFGLRRAQGLDGGLSASQYAYLGGFDSTSNVLAGWKYGIPVAGTMAHSFVTSYSSLDQIKEQSVLNGVNIKAKSIQYRHNFEHTHTNDGELAAFIDFAMSFPDGFTCLVDSYNTLVSGVPNFLFVAMALQDAGHQPKGIRLDSGDLASLSKSSKLLFKQFGDKSGHDFSKCLVTVSDNINEKTLEQMNKAGHAIDVYGIGTNIATCQKQPALGMVYKLVDVNSEAKMKCSESQDKATLPGDKRVYRIRVSSNKSINRLDVIALPNENLQVGQPFNARSFLGSNANSKFIVEACQIEEVLTLSWDQGKFVKQIHDIHESKRFVNSQIATFGDNVMKLNDGTPYDILLTEAYYHMFIALQDKIKVEQNIM